MANPGQIEIVDVESEDQLSRVKQLFQEYWDSFGFTPCFQNFDSELASLPGKYARPKGRLALALADGEPAGCIALRPIDETRCEAKRLYVRPQFRNLRIGRMLLDWLIAEARGSGYSEMLADTMPAMGRALAMYDRIGFERTEPHSDEITPGAIYFRLPL